jgi:8-oxo-dGTP pyrophosphatase MutT (NUDIX family)
MPVLEDGIARAVADMELTEKIRKVLSARRRKSVSTDRLTRAAVLVPLFEKGGRPYVLFTKRTERVKHHKGQISFPGGVVDETDQDMEATALREAFEEIGLDRGNAEILGKLDDAFTVSSGYLITPIVAEITCRYPFSINEDEIEEIIEVPLEAFLEDDRWREDVYSNGSKEVHSYRFEYEGRIIWGATARIMRQFLDALFGNKPRVESK